jgi:hypothetical protein
MSAAYARTLIHQGKAQVWPHPAFSVVQLTRVVDTPTLRPVLTGVALSTHLADLVFVIDQLRGTPSTIHMVVDLRFLPQLNGGHQGRWEPRRQRIPFTHVGSVTRLSDRVHMLLTAIRACHAVIPMSHLVLLPSARRTALTPPHAWWIEHRLATRVRRFISTIAVVHQHTHLSGEAPWELTGPLIERMIWAAREAPQFVVCAPTDKRTDRHPTYQDRRWGEHQRQPVLSPLLEPYLDFLGHLCTLRLHRRMITGVLHALEPPDHLLVKVPVQVNDQGVQWQLQRIPVTASLHVWPSTPIWLLPLTRMSHEAHAEQ